jgi:hypothetical protein
MHRVTACKAEDDTSSGSVSTTLGGQRVLGNLLKSAPSSSGATCWFEVSVDRIGRDVGRRHRLDPEILYQDLPPGAQIIAP